ncbi:Protein AJM-1 d [Aphelenchoides avenae]|nr:Protein AJM-1 d [Aphelenchus avenae]
MAWQSRRSQSASYESYAESGGYRTDGENSRDDLMSEGHRSRSTVREIPIYRSAGSFGPAAAMSGVGGGIMGAAPLTGGGTSVWSTTKYDPVTGAPQHEEYYRKEVMTRTLVTRSTEALSAPLSRSSPVEHYRHRAEPSDEVTEEYRYKYYRNVEEEERRIRESQEHRRREEEERRKREDEQRRQWEIQQAEYLEKLRREREVVEKEMEQRSVERERAERDRIERDRLERRRIEEQRRQEWERLENERKLAEEQELARRREMERIERERFERARLEAERLERERLERERLELERQAKEAAERERIERERIEIERLEIERIERIKREQREKEIRERERQREEAERLERERLEATRLELERLELERKERELLEQQRLEAEQRERERREEELREHRRREQERRDREILEQAEREAVQREMERKMREKMEQERLDRIRAEQERLEFERIEAERREKARQEDERREQELLEDRRRAHERRERERAEERERERQRQLEEQQDRDRIAALEAAAAERRAQRTLEERRQRELLEIERRAEELREHERREKEKRERERLEEERRLAELRELERRNAEQRDKERREAAAREAARAADDRRSRDRLDIIAREREEKERWEMEKKRLIAEHEALARKRQGLTSRETLERLTRKPYYSGENLAYLSGPDVTTKVERQVIERVDRTLWTSDETRYPSSSIGALPALDTLPDDYGGGYGKERIYNPRDDEMRRGASSRTSKYKAKMEKARKEFLQSDSGGYTDPLSDRFRKSTEDLNQRKIEYRGPLLQKFHSGEFSSRSADVGLLGPSSHKAFEAAVDEMNRSRSVLDINTTRQSRKDLAESEEVHHSRSKSADYLMDRRTRDDAAPPENDLQKTAVETEQRLSEYERFRKSTEKLSVPRWYDEHRTGVHSGRDYGRPTYDTAPPPPVPYSASSYERHESRYTQPWSYTAGSEPAPPEPRQTPASPPIGGISFPAGMFDKYKDEIEDMRRSRTSLHQLGMTQDAVKQTKDFGSGDFGDATVTREYSREAFTKTNIHVSVGDRQLPGYTVSTVPVDWHLPTDKHSRVIEVADTFIGKDDDAAAHRYGGRVTVEEVLDSIFQKTVPSNIPSDPTWSAHEGPTPPTQDGPSIFSTNKQIMDEIIKTPELAESLLRNQLLWVRCGHCQKTRRIEDARSTYVSCKHCYTYYCGRTCRHHDWDRHRDRCSFARINTLCKEVIIKVRCDPETQYHMSRVARDGFRQYGRGSVNIRLTSAHSAQMYLSKGWKAFSNQDISQLLFYYPIQSLIDQRKEPSLIQLCRKYNPSDKFILSVSIIADIEHCPETPPPEPEHAGSGPAKPYYPSIIPYYDKGAGNIEFQGAAIPTSV